ncbi:hypothetical protein [Gallaecimonas sp. GXIMD4217]|uniref:hypothetical protein n=1 Tax=Gallaecimonas sp. GXIMD4217 TaxID=3131927 RepID=UPI00311AC488
MSLSNEQRTQLLNHLKDNLKVAYQKALDADARLDGLARENLAQFEAVLTKDAGFQVEAKRFKPYVEELAGDIAALEGAGEAAFLAGLQQATQKLKVLLETLARLKTL